MKRRMTSLLVATALVAGMMLTAAPMAFAGDGPVAGCQPGPSGQGAESVSAWRLVSFSDFVDFLMDRYDIDEEDRPEVEKRAELTFDFCDKNIDGYACLQTKQRTAHDVHSGGWLIEDNKWPLT